MPEKNAPHNREETHSFPRGKERIGYEARRVASRLLELVVDEHHSLAALCDANSGNAAYRGLIAKDRALARAIVTTVLRHRMAILAVMKKTMDRPEPKRARELSHALHVAAAQILFMKVPDSAAVNLAVTAIASNRKTQRFKGFANAVLRNISRQKDTLLANTVAQAQVMPPWLSKRVRSNYGKAALARMGDYIRAEPLLDIQLKPQLDHQEWAEKLDGMVLPNGTIRTASDTPVNQMPGYDEGQWWVQNAAASIPASLFGDVKDLQIADLCSAPGGKAAQLASAGAKVTAVDNEASRLDRLKDNFQRLNLEVQTVCIDLLDWEPDQLFDCTLLDAPCSSTGTLRRHPDVMWTRKEEEIEILAALQKSMILKAISITKPGGLIVFATCSLLKAEGEDLFAWIGKQDELIEVVPVKPEEVGGMGEIINSQGAVRTLPFHMDLGKAEEEAIGNGGLDGFFAGRLRRL